MYLNFAESRSWATHQPRETTKTDDGKDNGGISTSAVVFIVVASVAVLLISAVIWTCYSRRSKQPISAGQTDQKKKTFFGRITSHLRSGSYEQAAAEDSEQPHQLSTTQRSQRSRNVEQTTNRDSAATTTVDRNTSVRSVMTLPAYRQSAATNERVLGREGERDGIDVIVDLPTQEEEEELRDQEMAALYDIRTTRRQLLAEREERREQRREARRRGDRAALEDLRNRTRAANEDTSLRDLRQQVERIKETRNRSVSSVSYADVGLARHDGTRIRANSTESERVGLLSDAGSISRGHQRERSASSAASAESDVVSLTATRTRGSSQSGGLWVTNGHERQGSDPNLVETDLGDTAMPPPEYEDVSLWEESRSTTPRHEPPPDYPGPYRSASQRTHRSLLSVGQHESGSNQAEEEEERDGQTTPRPPGRGVDGIPHLPSLRITPLPEIIIEPSSAHPRDDERHESHSW
ncbi:hypothetical protein BGZ63DRAFT_416414 [Mariannaea sp. PMI_226]|nr:hypothetical protein BGZ63DRAFT_416414 [Mariannaea sp. PMI_226]